MVQIPVHNENSFEPELILCEFRGDGDVVVQAEPLGAGFFRVVSRRTDQGKSVMNLSGTDCSDGPAEPSCGEQGGFMGQGTGSGVGIEGGKGRAFGRLKLLT